MGDHPPWWESKLMTQNHILIWSPWNLPRSSEYFPKYLISNIHLNIHNQVNIYIYIHSLLLLSSSLLLLVLLLLSLLIVIIIVIIIIFYYYYHHYFYIYIYIIFYYIIFLEHHILSPSRSPRTWRFPVTSAPWAPDVDGGDGIAVRRKPPGSLLTGLKKRNNWDLHE